MTSSISGGSNSDYLAYLLKELSSSSSSDSSATSDLLSSASTATNKSGSNPINASSMFAKLTKILGGDGQTITKSELESYIKKVETNASGKEDTKSLGFLKQLDKNWNSISGGSDSITEAQLASGLSYLKPPSQSSDSNSSSTDLFSSLANATGASSTGITKDDLIKYLKNLLSELDSSSNDSTNTASGTTTTATSSTSTTDSTIGTSDVNLAKEIKMIANLINNFDTFSGGSSSITSGSFYSALQEPQDPSTITSSQLTFPIDIRV